MAIGLKEVHPSVRQPLAVVVQGWWRSKSGGDVPVPLLWWELNGVPRAEEEQDLPHRALQGHRSEGAGSESAITGVQSQLCEGHAELPQGEGLQREGGRQRRWFTWVIPCGDEESSEEEETDSAEKTDLKKLVEAPDAVKALERRLQKDHGGGVAKKKRVKEDEKIKKDRGRRRRRSPTLSGEKKAKKKRRSRAPCQGQEGGVGRALWWQATWGRWRSAQRAARPGPLWRWRRCEVPRSCGLRERVFSGRPHGSNGSTTSVGAVREEQAGSPSIENAQAADLVTQRVKALDKATTAH